MKNGDRRQRKPSSRSSWTPLGSVRYPILKLYLLFLLKLTFQCVSVNFNQKDPTGTASLNVGVTCLSKTSEPARAGGAGDVTREG